MRDDDKLSKAFIAQLFLRLQATLAINEWQHRLTAISQAEVEAGFERMAKRSGDKRDWPPGAAEFRALCRPHREPYQRTEFLGQPQLPHLEASKETALRYIARIRGAGQGAA
jgi:hypothetical protein